MSNNLAQGRQGSQQQIATRTDAQLYPTVSNSGLNLRSKSNTFLARHYNVVEFNSSNLPSSGLTNGGFCDIRLIQSDCVANMTLKFVVSNADPINATAVMTISAFSRGLITLISSPVLPLSSALIVIIS